MKESITTHLLLIVIAVMLVSCQLDGKCDDDIDASKNLINFKSTGESTIVTTKSELWWLSSVTVDGLNYYNLGEETIEDNFVIMVDSLTFERKDKTTILLKLGENPTLNEREFHISLQSGNCFDNITIKQSAD